MRISICKNLKNKLNKYRIQKFYFKFYTPWKLKAECGRDIFTLMVIATLFKIDKRWKQSMCPRIDEQNKTRVYTYNVELFTFYNEENYETCYNMDEPQGCYATWNKSQKHTYYMISLIWDPQGSQNQKKLNAGCQELWKEELGS